MRGARDCPLCGAWLPPRATHCPRCEARIAPLPRKGPQPPTTPARLRLSRAPWSRVVLLGLGAGAVLTALCAVGAAGWAVLQGDYLRAFGNAAGIAGGGVIVLSVLLGGIQVSRWWGTDIDQLRARALGGGAWAPARVRMAIGLAGLVPLAVSALLAGLGR